MKKFLTALKKFLMVLLTTILIGGYASGCIALGLLIVSTVVPPLQKPLIFYATLAVLSKIAMGRIFYVQIKKPP